MGVMERFGLQYVRGCEVVEVRDEGECSRPGQLISLCRQCLVCRWQTIAACCSCCTQVFAFSTGSIASPFTCCLPLSGCRGQADERLHGSGAHG